MLQPAKALNPLKGVVINASCDFPQSIKLAYAIEEIVSEFTGEPKDSAAWVIRPGIARATGLSLLTEYLTAASVPALRTGAADSDPLVRMAAVQAMAPLPLEHRLALAVPSLMDPARSVRIEAARLLAGTSPRS